MEAKTKASGDEVNENAAERSTETVEEKTEEDLSRILEDEPSLDSVVKPFVEDLTQTAKSLVQNVADHSSSYITQVEGDFENLALVSDPSASLRNSKPVQESSDAMKSASVEQENADLNENSRTIHNQPYAAVTAATRASWANCCGLLDVLRTSDQ